MSAPIEQRSFDTPADYQEVLRHIAAGLDEIIELTKPEYAITSESDYYVWKIAKLLRESPLKYEIQT